MHLKNSGYVAVGHLLANKEPDTYIKTLRHFCTVIFSNVDENLIHKSSGFWLYDHFFHRSEVAVSVEGYSKFLSGILRKRDTDEFLLQLRVERLVWDLVKYDYDDSVCTKITRSEVLFRLFCIFNRFCHPDRMPMVLKDKAACFILKEIGVPPFKNDCVSTFADLVAWVREHRHLLQVRAVKKLYDEYVRDIIKEGRVKYRVLEGIGLVAAAAPVRTVAVTSSHLVVYENSEHDDQLEQPQRHEPTGPMLHRIPLIDTHTKVLRSIFGKNKMFLQLSSRSRNTPIIELIFDQSKEHFDLYSWSQALQEAAHNAQVNTNRLSKAYLRLGMLNLTMKLSPPNPQPVRRSSAPESPLIENVTKLRHLGRSNSDCVLGAGAIILPSSTNSSPESTLKKREKSSSSSKKLKDLPGSFSRLSSSSMTRSPSAEDNQGHGGRNSFEKAQSEEERRESSLLKATNSPVLSRTF